jgi:hypothetical protein
MEEWHAFFDEDAFSRGFIVLQKGEDEGTREVFDTLPSDQVEESGFERRLSQLLAVAKDEAARRSANETRRAISLDLDAGKVKTAS